MNYMTPIQKWLHYGMHKDKQSIMMKLSYMEMKTREEIVAFGVSFLERDRF